MLFAHGPNEAQETNERFAIANRGTFISDGGRGILNKVVRRAGGARNIHKVNADRAHGLAHGPLERFEKNAYDEPHEELGVNDVKNLRFLCREFGLNFFAIVCHCRVVDVVPLQPTNGSHWSVTFVKID